LRKGERDCIRARLEELADPRGAAAAKAVHRCPCRFRGVSAFRVRALARQVARRHHRDRPEEVLEIARWLWRSPWHEDKSVAVHLASILAPRLEDRHWKEFRRWVERARGAGHADAVAVQVLGRMVERDRTWCRVLRHWTLSPEPRVRRAAAGAVLLRTRHMGDVEAALSVCEPLMLDRSPEVREAVAAVLQQALRAGDDETRRFLERWRGRVPRGFLSAILRASAGGPGTPSRWRAGRRSGPGGAKDGI